MPQHKWTDFLIFCPILFRAVTMADDFHVLLPSNASPSIYATNTPSNFKVELPQRVDLKGDWRVGLLEMNYVNSLLNVRGGHNWMKVIFTHWRPYSPLAQQAKKESL